MKERWAEWIPTSFYARVGTRPAPGNVPGAIACASHPPLTTTHLACFCHRGACHSGPAAGGTACHGGLNNTADKLESSPHYHAHSPMAVARSKLSALVSTATNSRLPFPCVHVHALAKGPPTSIDCLLFPYTDSALVSS